MSNLKAIKHHFENYLFAATSGMRLLGLRLGYAKTSHQIEDRHRNHLGTVQGGVIFTLADFAFGVASKTGGKVAMAISANILFLEAARSRTLYAEAIEARLRAARERLDIS